MLTLARTPTPTPMTQVVVVEEGGGRAVVAAGAKAAAGLDVVDATRETVRVRRQTRAKHLRRLRTSHIDYH